MSSHRKQQKSARHVEPQAERLRPENRRLLAFLKEFMKTPDEMGEAWWDEFRDFLRKNPVRIGKPERD